MSLTPGVPSLRFIGRNVRILSFISRNFDHDKPAEDLLDWERRNPGDDRPVVESQRRESLSLNLGKEFHIEADQMSVAYRQELARLGLGRPMTA